MNVAHVYLGRNDVPGVVVHVHCISALDTLAKLHALAPHLELLVYELEEETAWGSPRWTKVEWRFTPSRPGNGRTRRERRNRRTEGTSA